MKIIENRRKWKIFGINIIVEIMTGSMDMLKMLK